MWDGSSQPDGEGYRKTSSYSIEKLRLYQKPLEALLSLTPSGFPAHNPLVDTFKELQSKYKVIDESGRFLPRAYQDAAFAWRAMTKAAYDLKKDGTVRAPVIQHLLALIELPQGPRSDSSEPAQVANPYTVSDVMGMFGDDGSSDDEVMVTSSVCKCPRCVVPAYADASAAFHPCPIEIPSCAKGGQRAQTLSEVKRRIRTKTKPTGPWATTACTVRKGSSIKKMVATRRKRSPQRESSWYDGGGNRTNACESGAPKEQARRS